MDEFIQRRCPKWARYLVPKPALVADDSETTKRLRHTVVRPVAPRKKSCQIISALVEWLPSFNSLKQLSVIHRAVDY